MKKRLISLVAAAALVGGVSIASTPFTAQAGTVTVKGDTQVELYGFVWTNFTWSKRTGNLDAANMPNLAVGASSKVSFDSHIGPTRIGFNFKNSDANLTGKIETDFNEEGGKVARVRRAFVKHNLGGGTYVLIGKEWVLEEMLPSISSGFTGPAGFDELVLRVPQVRIGSSFDMGGASLDVAVAFEDNVNGAAFKPYSEYTIEYDNKTTRIQETISRRTMPGVAGRIIAKIDTGFGAPAKVWLYGGATPIKVDYVNKDKNVEVTDKSETPVVFGAGFKLPVSMVTLGVAYQYAKGATEYAGAAGPSGLQPKSYYVVGDSLKATKFNAYQINAKISPMPCVSVGAEYDYVKFKNDDAFGGAKPKVETYIANIGFKTTKYTEMTVEWRHVKAKNFDALNAIAGTNYVNDRKSDQFSIRYLYFF